MSILVSDVEVDAPKDASGWAVDFTCPEHGQVYAVNESERGGKLVYTHAGCGREVEQDWWD